MTNRKSWFVPILCIGLAFLHGLFLYSAATGRDDAYITYWAAQSLSNFGKIINYNGEALEQSSSLLHVILLAILHQLSGISMQTIGGFFSATMGALTILATWRLAVFLNLRSTWFVALFLALFPYLVYSSFNGLETTLVVFIVVLLVYSVIRFLTEKVSFSLLISAILSIGAYILVRPEAIFVMLAFLMGIALYFIIHNFFFKKSNHFLYGTKDFQKWTILVSISLAIFILLSLWRYQIFGQIFPQPVYAKSSGLSTDKLITGFHYFFDHYWIPSLIILTGLTLLVIYDVLLNHKNIIKNTALMVMIIFIGATMAFSVTSGGDWMESGRFFVPILPLLVVSGLYALNQISHQQISKIVLIFIVLVAALDTVKFMLEEPWIKTSISTPLPFSKTVYNPVLHDFKRSEQDFSWFELRSRTILSHIPAVIMLDKVVKRLVTTQQTPLTLLSVEMGMLPFYIASKYGDQVKFMDMRALTTNHFTKCSLTNHLPKGRFGLGLSYEYLFAEFDQILHECLIKKPEIISDQSGKRRLKMLEQNGYKIVYFHLGWIYTGSCWIRNRSWTGFHIAVREDLVNRVGDLGPQAYKSDFYYKWPKVKCQ
ncbi:hypothetical protein [Candidatus Parabeggiatoa sp. HSG14]|uniref:hypothetical protein n=1 Tax=Candidatus Parabeggiatoa sp. HSG14 TaxID=3055593 RepID=UPI0025A76D10|nr:hypothetical protein [Thiotrichales bacterium HSG14]